MWMAGWGKHWTRRCQNQNCFENFFWLSRMTLKYSIKAYLSHNQEGHKYFHPDMDKSHPRIFLLIKAFSSRCTQKKFNRQGKFICGAPLIEKVIQRKLHQQWEIHGNCKRNKQSRNRKEHVKCTFNICAWCWIYNILEGFQDWDTIVGFLVSVLLSVPENSLLW